MAMAASSSCQRAAWDAGLTPAAGDLPLGARETLVEIVPLEADGRFAAPIDPVKADAAAFHLGDRKQHRRFDPGLLRLVADVAYILL